MVKEILDLSEILNDKNADIEIKEIATNEFNSLILPRKTVFQLCSLLTEISDQLKKASGLRIINNKNELANYFIDLIYEEHLLKEYGQASKEIFIKNRGAIEIINKTLQSLFKDLL